MRTLHFLQTSTSKLKLVSKSTRHIMDTQEQCPFLELPLEIRHAIYTNVIPTPIHVFLREGRVAISPCGEPNMSKYLNGCERRPEDSQSAETIWADRLQSSWGPHWQCEEVAQGVAGNTESHITRAGTPMSLIYACKRM